MMEAKIDDKNEEEEAEDDDDLEHEFLTNEKDLEIDEISRRGGNGLVASSSSEDEDDEEKFRFQRFDLEKKTRKRATSKR